MHAMTEQVMQTAFDPHSFLMKVEHERASSQYRAGQAIFSQGDPASSVFYLQHGKVKLTVIADSGREAVIAILQQPAFFGEGSLLQQPVRLSTATAITNCTLDRIGRTEMLKALHEEVAFAEAFTAHLLTRASRTEADLVDHLLNSSEKRLARALLLLANFGREGAPGSITTKISQQTLAEMVGTTRSRVSFFMNKFRKLGFIEYNGHLKVHSSLLSVLLSD
jgi:CRP/FNR family cyclic AMP-dependent transcriptional regulator